MPRWTSYNFSNLGYQLHLSLFIYRSINLCFSPTNFLQINHIRRTSAVEPGISHDLHSFCRLILTRLCLLYSHVDTRFRDLVLRIAQRGRRFNYSAKVGKRIKAGEENRNILPPTSTREERGSTAVAAREIAHRTSLLVEK